MGILSDFPYIIDEQNKKINDFICQEPLAVISTFNGVSTCSALIAFAQNSKLELYIMTFSDSRKYANLQENPYVSVVIGFGYLTIQYEGAAFLLDNNANQEALRAFSLKTTPCSSDFLNDSRARFFKIKPKWIRYSDYTIFPAEIFEKNF